MDEQRYSKTMGFKRGLVLAQLGGSSHQKALFDPKIGGRFIKLIYVVLQPRGNAELTAFCKKNVKAVFGSLDKLALRYLFSSGVLTNGCAYEVEQLLPCEHTSHSS